MALTGISLFTGAGGMDVGFSKAGFRILWANDIMKDACDTYAANHNAPIECGDLTPLIPRLSKFRGADVVFGGPPCQGFSVAGKMNPKDARSQMVFKFMDVVDRVRPRAFVMENVKALGALSKWDYVREALMERAEELGYAFRHIVILNATEFGVPQKRERMFFIGLRKVPSHINGTNFAERFENYKKKAEPVGKIFKELGPAGTASNTKVCKAKITLAANPILRKSPYAGMLFNGMGRPIDPNGYSNTLPASMGGNKTPIVDERQIFDGAPSWIEKYHDGVWNKRVHPEFKVAPRFLRRITVDEASRIQTFPKNYKFIGRQNSIYTQIGNAVPCKLAEVVANVVGDILNPAR